jgi:hypothetical protein
MLKKGGSLFHNNTVVLIFVIIIIIIILFELFYLISMLIDVFIGYTIPSNIPLYLGKQKREDLDTSF